MIRSAPLFSNTHPHTFTLTEPCTFPPEWAGHWFQKGVPDPIRIGESDISEKGSCKEISGDKFLIENRSVLLCSIQSHAILVPVIDSLRTTATTNNNGEERGVSEWREELQANRRKNTTTAITYLR
jgi:hypothetical protein